MSRFNAVMYTLLAITSTTALAEIKLVQELHEIEQHTDAKGVQRNRPVPATSVVPGDELRYRIRVINDGSEPATDIVVDNAVPANTTYVDGSAFGTGTSIEFSVNGGTDYDGLTELRVEVGDGVTRQATAADVTHIRWRFARPLPAGTETFVSFKVTVN